MAAKIGCPNCGHVLPKDGYACVWFSRGERARTLTQARCDARRKVTEDARAAIRIISDAQVRNQEACDGEE